MVEIKKLVTDFDKDNTPHWFKVDDKEFQLKWHWDTEYINLDTMEYYHCAEDEHTPIEGFHNLNQLSRMGHKVELMQPFNEVTWYPNVERPKRISPKKIQKEIAEMGFNVSIEGIIHQFDAWRNDYKSGYRDEQNGVFLFTPCGHNPFSINVSNLHHTAADWQETYYC